MTSSSTLQALPTVPAAPRGIASSPWVTLRQTDFAHGTYRIRSSGRYRLGENISFAPNPSYAMKPHADQSMLYPTTGAEGAYRLGFFAAITVEVADVIIDLDGHLLEQSEEHALRQRFYAHIELADQPFVPRQGPADFGATLDAAHRVVVRNGTLGRSSHHGIHGNDNRDVHVHDLIIRDFEVAAIALNGVRRALLNHLDIPHSRQTVPVVGAFSVAVFLQPLLTSALSGNETIVLRGQTHTRDSIRAALQRDIDATLAGHAPAQFRNVAGNTDGPLYGILIHKRGVAVNKFVCCSDLEDPTQAATDVTLRNIRISNIIGTQIETMAISKRGHGVHGPQTEAHGGVLPILEILASDGRSYRGTSLWDAVMLLAKHTTRTQIDPAIVAWAEAGSAGNLAAVMNAHQMRYLPNGDIMHHVTKGNMGIRCCGVRRLRMEDISITGVLNNSAAGSEIVAYYGPARGHSLQNPSTGFTGAEVRGISLSLCHNTRLHNIMVCNLRSQQGSATGIDVQNGTTFFRGTQLCIMDVVAAESRTGRITRVASLPNVHVAAIGVDIRGTSGPVYLRNTRVCRLTGPALTHLRSPTSLRTGTRGTAFTYIYDGVSPTAVYRHMAMRRPIASGL
jgi:hypothetical protein